MNHYEYSSIYNFVVFFKRLTFGLKNFLFLYVRYLGKKKGILGPVSSNLLTKFKNLLIQATAALVSKLEFCPN